MTNDQFMKTNLIEIVLQNCAVNLPSLHKTLFNLWEMIVLVLNPTFVSATSPWINFWENTVNAFLVLQTKRQKGNQRAAASSGVR